MAILTDLIDRENADVERDIMKPIEELFEALEVKLKDELTCKLVKNRRLAIFKLMANLRTEDGTDREALLDELSALLSASVTDIGYSKSDKNHLNFLKVTRS